MTTFIGSFLTATLVTAIPISHESFSTSIKGSGFFRIFAKDQPDLIFLACPQEYGNDLQRNLFVFSLSPYLVSDP